MLEESVESFITQWKPYAATVTLFPHTEGSPLLELSAGGRIFHVFERTSPYSSYSGKVQLIVHPVTERVQRLEEREKRVEVTGISRLNVRGVVLLRTRNMVVVDAGFPLVVGVFEGLPDDLGAGETLEFTSLPPVHGFLLPKSRGLAGTSSYDDI